MNPRTEVLRPARDIFRQPPANIDGRDDELFRDAYAYSTADCRLTTIGNAGVSADSVVYTKFTPLPESLYRFDAVGYYRFRYLTKMLLTARKVWLNSAEDYLLATDQESNGHFHWFTEVLPRLWLVKDRAAAFVLMLPDTPYMRSIAAESLHLLGIRLKEIFWMQSGEFYKVPRLHHVSKVSRTGQMDDAIMKELDRAFVGERPPGNRKCYVSRARARFRKVLNEDELESRLKAHGFEVIQPDDWTLAEQIAVFSECDTLIGIHGAGLTNCLFMRSGGTVVELRKREANYGYWHLAESVGHTYFYYHGVPDSELSLIGRGCNLTIPVDDFEKTILSRFA
jgi:hypothetical protein